MPIPEDEMIVETVDYFVSEHVLNPKASSQEIASFMKKRKLTGIITTNTNQGGVMKVAVVERSKLNDDEGNNVRRVLEMDYLVEDEGESPEA
jgi:hypothetical protein